MNKNILIVMGGGLIVAILVAMLVSMGLGNNAPEQKVREEGQIEILVAARDLKIGTEIGGADLKWQSWPQSAVFSGAIEREEGESLEEAVDGRLGRAVSEDEPIVRSALLDKKKGNFVAAMLKPGERAVAVPVNAESMVGGFVAPGDFVDVIWTYRTQMMDDDPLYERIYKSNADEYASETILQNVRVLAIDQTAEKKDDVVKVGKTVTIAVDQVGAEKVALAQEDGEIMLALRGIGDDVIEKSSERPVVSDMRIIRLDEELREQYITLYREGGPELEKQIRIYNGPNLQTIKTR